jgi:2-polyprenyl-3-methyl-5-hydroxy-6-metoxy-1,4-benzoquinol methylase
MNDAVLSLHRPRLSQIRNRVRDSIVALAHATYEMARKMPLPRRLRSRAARLVVWHRGTTEVPIGKVLLGGQNGLDATAYTDETGDLLWPSRRVIDGPHAELLGMAFGSALTDEQILGSAYATMARHCIQLSGQYFTATDDAGIVEVAREFIGWASADVPVSDHDRRPHHSEAGTPVLLAPIRHSDCYQVVDGHHRVAALGVAGATSVPARIKRVKVETPLQTLLQEMSWIGGEHELYQPVFAPELEQSWVTVRNCADRLAGMEKILAELGVEPTGASYLDVASCYGWFLSAMDEFGFDVQGVERDPSAPKLGEAIYGLDPDRVHVGDAAEFLHDANRTWDVVSCFSLLHHFALGRAEVGAEELMHLLDEVTGRVLFLDTGQAHEAWFRDSLPDWDADYVAGFIARHGTFDRVIDLGPDLDAVGPYEGNYGRHLFAAIR